MTIDTSQDDKIAAKSSPVLAPGAKLERLTGGFYNISGAAVDPSGQLYFVDAHWQRIYRWLPGEKERRSCGTAPRSCAACASIKLAT